MMWTAWRQQRTVFLAFAVATAVLIGYALFTGLHAQSSFDRLLLAPCHGDVSVKTAYENYCNNLFHASFVTYGNVIGPLGYVFAAIIGILLGAIAIASDLERGTVRLVWTQSLSRSRWFTTKVLVGGSLVAVLTGLLSVTFTWWDHASRYAARVAPNGFYISGWMLVVTGLFGFSLAVLMGVAFRRTGWSVGVAFILLVVASFVGQSNLLSHLVSLRVVTVGVSAIHNTKSGEETHGGAPSTAWIIYGGLVAKTATAPPASWNAALRMNGAVVSCMAAHDNGANSQRECLNELGLRNVEIYVADSEFWTMQLREGALYLAVGALFLGASVVVLRRRRA